MVLFIIQQEAQHELEVKVAKYSRGQGADLKVIHYCALANKLQVLIILLLYFMLASYATVIFS